MKITFVSGTRETNGASREAPHGTSPRSGAQGTSTENDSHEQNITKYEKGETSRRQGQETRSEDETAWGIHVPY